MIRSRSVYGGRRRRVVRRRPMLGRRRVVRRRPMLGGMYRPDRPLIPPYPILTGMRRRRRMRGRGIGSSIGSWLGDKAESVIRGHLGLGRKRRRRRFALGRRPMTYVGSARRSRSRYSY